MSKAIFKYNYDKSIHHNPSAAAWAKFFIQTIKAHDPQIDEGFMIGWFANAMMAMHDHVSINKDQTIQRLEDALRDMGEALGFYVTRSNIDTNSVLDFGKRARETLQNHSELLSKIYEEKKG